MCMWESHYLNHLASLELLDVAELARIADQFAALQIDNALGVTKGNSTYHESRDGWIIKSLLTLVKVYFPCDSPTKGKVLSTHHRI